MAKTRTVTGAGLLAAAILVLLFGNQAVTEWVPRHSEPGTLWGWFLRTLTWPAWEFVPRDSSAAGFRNLLAVDLRAILLLAFVAVLLSWIGKGVTAGAAAFFLGWATLVFASAFAAFLTAFILSNPTFLGALGAAAAGSAYGLYVGWIVGIVTSTAKKSG